jgi:hypothetical protein
MRRFCPAVVIAACLACAFAAGKKPDFSGDWVLDPDKTEIERSEPRGLPKLKVSVGVIVVTPDEGKPKNLPPPPPEERMKNLTLHIDQSGGAIRIQRTFLLDGETEIVDQTFNLDGSRDLNPGSDGQGEFVTHSSWEKNRLINDGIKTIRDQAATEEIYVKEEYSISKNGKKLTLKMRDISREGVVKIKQQFTRQDPGSKAEDAP